LSEVTGGDFDSTGPRTLAEYARLGWLWWLLGSVGVVVAAVLLRFEPPDQIIVPVLNLPLPQSCWTRRWLGFSCPGCGLTRSFVLAAHGQFGQAFQMHPVGAFVFSFLVLQIPIRLYQVWLFARRRAFPAVITRYVPQRYLQGFFELWLLVFATGAAFAWWAFGLLFR
jgi:hypothetical protein